MTLLSMYILRSTVRKYMLNSLEELQQEARAHVLYVCSASIYYDSATVRKSLYKHRMRKPSKVDISR